MTLRDIYEQLKAFDDGLAQISRAQVEALTYGNPCNLPGFEQARGALERLFAFKDVATIEAALGGLDWSDDRCWLLFRIIAGGYGGHFNGPSLWVNPVAIAALRAVADKANDGDGAKKLWAMLVRLKVRARARGQVVPVLPERLPTNVQSALAMMTELGVTAEEMALTKPAATEDLEELERVVDKLPAELDGLLRLHGSVSDRELGPPSQMLDLQSLLNATVEEHANECDEPPSGEGEYDVRRFTKGAVMLGTDHSGDLYFIAPSAISDTGDAPVIQFRHDEALVATVAASSLGEYLAILIARVYARREGLSMQLRDLVQRKRKV